MDLRENHAVVYDQLFPPSLPCENGPNLSESAANLLKVRLFVEKVPLADPKLPKYKSLLGMLFLQEYSKSGNLEDLKAAIQNQEAAVNLTSPGDHDRPEGLQRLALHLGARYRKLRDLKDLEASLKNLQEAHISSPRNPDLLYHISVTLEQRHRRLQNPVDIETAIQSTQTALNLTLDGHRNRPEYLNHLADLFTTRYFALGILGNMQDLQIALNRNEEAVALTPKGDPEEAQRIQNLGVSFLHRYENTGCMADLSTAMEKFQKAVDLTPPGHSKREKLLQSLAEGFSKRFGSTGVPEDLHEALKIKRQIMEIIPDGHPSKSDHLSDLGASLKARYELRGDLKDLDESVQKFKEAINLAPDNAIYRQNLAASLLDRYGRLGDLQDLKNALDRSQEAVDMIPTSHRRRATCLQTYGVALRLWNARDGLRDLAHVLRTEQEAVNSTPLGHVERHIRLMNLGISYSRQYENSIDPADLEKALETLQEAVNSTPTGHPDRAGNLKHLGINLRYRFQRSPDRKDIDKAIEVLQEAVNLTPMGLPLRAELLQALGVSFTCRHEIFGYLDDLEAAIKHAEDALDLPELGQCEKSACLQNLAVGLGYRYKRLGALKDLEAEVQKKQEALDLLPGGNAQRIGCLMSLAISLKNRYQRLGDLQDLELALQRDKEAVDLIPDGHPERGHHLQSLAASYAYRYRRLNELNDLEAALRINQEAVDLALPGDPHRAGCLQGLALSLMERYHRLDGLNDLETALEKSQEAVRITAIDHRLKAWHLQNLAMLFMTRHQRHKIIGERKALNDALQAAQDAVDLTGLGNPDKALRLQTLGNCFRLRYEICKNPEDLKAMRMNYLASFETLTSTPEGSWECAVNWAYFSADSHPSDCVAAFSAAFHLLPDILWIGNSIPTRHDVIHRLHIEHATSAAAGICIKYSNLPFAVEIMEQGLATTFQQMLQLKTNLDGLHHDQAEKFNQLSSELYGGTSDDIKRVASERNELLEEIRKQPHLEYFLRPKPYSELRHASADGPIVILNSHRNCCDAIIIPDPKSEPVHVPLSAVTLDMVKLRQAMLTNLLECCNVRSRGDTASSRLFGSKESSNTTEGRFSDLLTWVSGDVAGPIYAALEERGIRDGRLWWLPTGAFTGLPLHAACPTNQFIHSYTATLGSLLDARAKKSSNIPARVGVIGVTHTGPGNADFLKGVKPELEKIFSIIPKTQVECLEGPSATVDSVKQCLAACSWAHLACHGTQNVYAPTKSYLKLYGGQLELETILRMQPPNAQVVFLAACKTAMGANELVNQSFHLTGGFIAAGFRGAIGTLWVWMIRTDHSWRGMFILTSSATAGSPSRLMRPKRYILLSGS
ncbi:CHAT domain-containing protein [Mycena latifolia]|nr:CHAT domain-containing protein [Mycena latifolia]